MRKENLAARSSIVTVIITLFLILIAFQTVTFAQWMDDSYERVNESINSSGQTEYAVVRITNGISKETFKILARGSNAYNVNTNTVLNRESLGPKYVKIDEKYYTYVITTYHQVKRYSKNFKYNSTPQVLMESGAYDFDVDPETGFAIGIYTYKGYYDLRTNKFREIIAGTINVFPNVEKIENTYIFNVNSYEAYKIKWNGEGSTLYIDGTNVSNNVIQLRFSKNYILFAKKENEGYKVPLNSTDAELITTDWYKFIEDSQGWVTKVEDSEGTFDVNGSGKSKYPKIEKKGRNYYFYINKRHYYIYRLDSDGELVYKGDEKESKNKVLDSEVWKVDFSKKSIVWVNEQDKVHSSEVGSNSTKFICKNFKKFIMDDDDFVDEVKGDGYYNYKIDK